MRCPICGTYMGTLASGVCGVCAEKYSAPPPSEVERLRAENKTLKSLLTEARENVDLDVRELEAMYVGYPEIMERKTAADRDLRNRIDAALAAKGE